MQEKKDVEVSFMAPAELVADVVTRAAAFGWSEGEFWAFAASNALYGFAKAMNMTGQSGPDGDE